MKQIIKQNTLNGSIPIPASKSHTIRAILIASLAKGTSRVIEPLNSADTRACIDACKALGADIYWEEEDLVIRGTAGVLANRIVPIDVGNSGTTLYLAIGTAALGSAEVVFDGDSQIQSRPIGNLLDSLNDLGAQAVSTRGNGCAPVSITGPLAGGKTSIECPTSQYLSSLLLAAPLGRGDSEIDVPLLHEQPYVEMTLRWLDEQKISYTNNAFRNFVIPGNQHYTAFTKKIPADFSSATFFLVGAAITGSRLSFPGLDMNDSQGDKATVSMLEKMGCSLEISSGGIEIEGPVPPASLQGCDFDLNATPDALPAMAVAGCFARGTTRLFNVPQARIKETDRITVMREELTRMGADIEELEDGLVIHGKGGKNEKPLTGTAVHGHSDHRVVMSLAIAGLGAEGETTVDTAEAVNITFPGFFDLLIQQG